MPVAKEPSKALKAATADLPDVVQGTSCNQAAYKVEQSVSLCRARGKRNWI